MTELEFKLEHLDKYAIIKEPCTLVIKNNSILNRDKLYKGDGHPRWILLLKAISEENLNTLKALVNVGVPLTYGDIGYLLMKGSIWIDQINDDISLPCKGEELIAVFDYVEGKLLCTSITLIPRREPILFHYYTEASDELNEFENIIKNMK